MFYRARHSRSHNLDAYELRFNWSVATNFVSFYEEEVSHHVNLQLEDVKNTAKYSSVSGALK